MKPLTELDALATQIGKFIRYWGFKEIHGRIWTHLYLSSEPLSSTELAKRLGVSKALISLSVRDLLEFDVIQEARSGRYRSVYYRANPDIVGVITRVLRSREKYIMDRVASAHTALQSLDRARWSALKLDEERITALGKMVDFAASALNSLIFAREMQFDLGPFSSKQSSGS